MLIGVKSLEHYTVHATDGDIGRVHDLYFDDVHWAVRHAVVGTGHWLARHRVLVPFASLLKADPTGRELHVSLTRSRVARSPEASTEQPVSRQHEADLYRYYGFPFYWAGPAMDKTKDWEGRGDPHLRSARAVSGYLVREVDGEVGRVDDLLVDDDGWMVRYLVVDTGGWWPERKVLVAPSWISGIEWAGADVLVDLTRADIKAAPAYDPAQPVDRAYEERLHAHYARRPYWHHDAHH